MRLSFTWLTTTLLAAILLTACEGEDSRTSPSQAALSPEQKRGESLFAANCASCHGQKGRGTEQGPPLIHRIYEPSHHADFSFYRAVANGVKAHHWDFGDMPPISGVSPEEVGQIIAYIRWEQRRAGIN